MSIGWPLGWIWPAMETVYNVIKYDLGAQIVLLYPVTLLKGASTFSVLEMISVMDRLD